MPDRDLTIAFENAAGQLLEHPAGYIMVRYFHRKRVLADLTALVSELGQRLLRYGWCCLLADTRELPILTEAEKEWISANWLGRQVPRPPRLWVASLQPTEVFSRLSVGEVQHGVANENVTYQYFTELAPAHAWLVEMAGR